MKHDLGTAAKTLTLLVDEIEQLEKINKHMLRTLKEFNFVPACGDKFCRYINTETIDHFELSGLCDDEEQCRWAFKYGEKVKTAIKIGNTVLEEIEK